MNYKHNNSAHEFLGSYVYENSTYDLYYVNEDDTDYIIVRHGNNENDWYADYKSHIEDLFDMTDYESDHPLVEGFYRKFVKKVKLKKKDEVQ